MKRFYLLYALCMFSCACALAGPKIYINPGHGGYNSNDRNIVTINHKSGDQSGFWESQANLTKGLYLRDMLQAAGATVYMSRTDNRSGYRDDTSISNTIGDRPLSTIAKEASNKPADFFLSIHSNAGNTETSTSNYLLLMLTGTSGSGDWASSFKYAEAKTAADKAATRLLGNSVTCWSSTTARVQSFTSYTVISPSYLTIPGYLSEGEFHDYKAETHRLLNDDYCKLEAYRFLQAFCDYYTSSLTKPTTGVICGDVRDASATMADYAAYKPIKTGSKDEYKPLNGAKVKLMKDGNVIATYTCDNEWNGFYAFWDVAPGTYTVQCAAADHASVTNTVTVSAATISYNNVKLSSGSGDGMEDETITPVSVLYDTLINQSAATWLNAKTIRRALVKDEKLYVLTSDNTIHVVNANTGVASSTLNTSGISGSERNIGDIALTSDGILLASTQDHTVSGGTVYMKVYKWTADNAAPALLFQSSSSANMYDASVGRSIAASGSVNNLRLFTLAYSLQSAGIRLLQHTWNGSSVTTIQNNNTTGNTLGDSTIWNTAALTASPFANTQFLMNSKTIRPTMLSMVQTDKSTFSKTEYTNLDLATCGGTFVSYNNHSLYITPYGSDNLGVGIYDATNGLASASLIKTLFPETTLSLANAGYMTAAAQVENDELVVTLYAQNRGITRWRLSENELETTTPVVIEPEDVVEGANIFASELTMSESDEAYTFSFRLNEDATDVTLQLLYEGAVIQSVSFGTLPRGYRDLTLPKADINFPTRNNDDHLTWAIKATGKAINTLTKLSNDDAQYQFYRPFGVAVDQNPESEFFGRVYVTNVKNGTCTNGRTTANGLYAFDAGLNALNTSAYTGGVTWNNSSTNGNSPFRLAVAEDGRVFLCDWADSHSGIWIAPAGGITGNFTELFASLTRASSGLASNGSTPVHGSISGCWVEGTGANTKLYTMDEDYTVDGKTGNMLRYDIGTATSWTAAPSAVEYNNYANGGLLVNMTLQMVSDKRGGWWIIQNRYAENSKEPSLIHVRNGSVDYNTGGEQLLDNSCNGGLAVNYDGTRIATTSQSQINVWNVTYTSDGAFESISPVCEITTKEISGLGTNSNDVAFDPAGNLYYVSNTTERLVVIGMPKADNSFTTPARSIYPIALPAETPTISVKVTEWAANGLTVDFGEAPAANGVIVTLDTVVTDVLPLETAYAHTAGGLRETANDKHISLPETMSFAATANKFGKALTFTWMNNNEVIGITETVLPIIVAKKNTYKATYWPETIDVIVLPGVQLTLDLTKDKTVRSLEIYPGGKVIVKGALTVTDLIFRYGWLRDYTKLNVPKLNTDNGSITSTNAYLDCAIDYAQYYPFAVPYEVTTSGISYRDYPDEPVASNVIIRQYNSERRASGKLGNNWTVVTPTKLVPTNGYAITAKRPDDVMFSTVRMPLNMSATQSSAAVTAYGASTGYWYNIGWNFIANPYLQTFSGASADEFGVRYVTIPNADFRDYYQSPVDEAKLEPMSPFFVQVDADATITFAASHLSLAPARNKAMATEGPTTDLRLRFGNGSTYDQTYVLLGKNYTDDPDFNADLAKEFGLAPKIWSVYNDQSLASLALPDTRQEYYIPLAVQTAAAGIYTFELNEYSKFGDIERVELLDDGAVVADLMTDNYQVSLTAGTIEGRFALRCVRANHVTTDKHQPTTNAPYQATKRLEDQRVVIDINGTTYDILGNEVR